MYALVVYVAPLTVETAAESAASTRDFMVGIAKTLIYCDLP